MRSLSTLLTEFKSDRIVARSLPESGVSLCPPLPFYWLEFPVIVHAFHPPLLQPTTYKRTVRWISCISNTIASITITCNNSCIRVLYCYSQTSCFTFYYYMYQYGIICAIILNSLNLCDEFGNMVDAKFLLESTHFALIPTNY